MDDSKVCNVLLDEKRVLERKETRQKLRVYSCRNLCGPRVRFASCESSKPLKGKQPLYQPPLTSWRHSLQRYETNVPLNHGRYLVLYGPTS